MVDISIIIRTKNEEKNIGEVLAKVFSQDVDLGFEVVIVDSGSTDRTLDIVSQYNCRLIKIPPEPWSPGYALNIGSRYANGNYLVYLSAHCPPLNDRWLHNLVKNFIEEKVAAVYGRQIPVKGRNPFEDIALYLTFPARVTERRSILARLMIMDKDGISFANCAIRKSVWEKYPLNEEIPFAEDRLWAKVIVLNGYKILYEPESVVYHSHPYNLSSLSERMYKAAYAAKVIYGPECRYDSVFWICLMIVAAVLRDILYFIATGNFRFIPKSPRYRCTQMLAMWKGAKSI